MEPEPEPENSDSNNPIIIPISLSTLLTFNNSPFFSMISNNNSLEEQITDNSFHERPSFKHVCSKEFINSLSIQKTSQDLVDQKITCGICLDELKLNEDIIELPCKDKHYFHIKNEGCPGIYPWIKENNTCPLCRFKFPSEEKKLDNTSQSPQSPQSSQSFQQLNNILDITPSSINNMINEILIEREERMMQEILYNSLSNG